MRCLEGLLEERELFAIRARLTAFPAAVRAIAELACAKHQFVEQIRPRCKLGEDRM